MYFIYNINVCRVLVHYGVNLFLAAVSLTFFVMVSMSLLSKYPKKCTGELKKNKTTNSFLFRF